MDEPFEIEVRGAAEGINPMFGEWRQTFNFCPVSYANAGKAKADFKQAVRNELKNKFVFVGQVSLTATLYLNEQKILETAAYGDLDNYAKQLLDTIKGNGGILIDDCQVQHINISWIDVPKDESFEIEIKASPDDFLPTPLKLYRMPDGLYYPISELLWTTEGVVSIPSEATVVLAQAFAKMTSNKKSFRHQLRQEGVQQFRAFQNSQYVSPVLMGFHRSRVVDSGFELIERIE